MRILRHPISGYDQILDRFYVISMEFLPLSGRFSSSWNTPQWQWARRKVCFRRLGYWTVNMSLCFILLLFPVNVVVGYLGFNKVFGSRWEKLWRRQRWKKLAPVSRVVHGHTPPPPENLRNPGLLEYISSILEQKLEFLNRTQTSLNFGFFIQWQQMNDFFELRVLIYLFLVASSYSMNHWLF